MTGVREPALDEGRKWPRMTYEEYLDAPGIDENTEWVDGEVVPMMSVSPLHGRLVKWLTVVFTVVLEQRGFGEVFNEPVNMKTGSDLPGRSPDVMFLRTEHLDRVTNRNINGPADLVIEVISPGTEGIDRGDKYYEYERGGVPEYWLLDPHRQVADFFVRDERGYYRPQLPDADGVYHSTVIDGLWLKVAWLWDRPPLREVETELGLR